MVNQVTVLGPIAVRWACEYGNDVFPSAPLHALQRSQLSDLAAAHGHCHRLTTLSTAHQIACVLAELPQSCLSHDTTVALVLPRGDSRAETCGCEERVSVVRHRDRHQVVVEVARSASRCRRLSLAVDGYPWGIRPEGFDGRDVFAGHGLAAHGL